jgi:hypothetical protein
MTELGAKLVLGWAWALRQRMYRSIISPCQAWVWFCQPERADACQASVGAPDPAGTTRAG